MDLHHEVAELLVLLVDLEGGRFRPFLPVAHDDEGCRDVDAVVRHTTYQQRHDVVLFLFADAHQVVTPVPGRLHQWPEGQLTLGLMQFEGPLLQGVHHLDIHLGLLLEGHHLVLRGAEGQHGQTAEESAAEVTAVHLPVQGQRSAGIDVVPVDVERAVYRVHVLILLVVLLVVEGLQLKDALVDPLSAAAVLHVRVQLRVEGEEVQVHGFAVHLLDILHHVLDEDPVGRLTAVDADLHVGVLDGGALLLVLLRGGPFLDLLLIVVDHVVAHLVVGNDGGHDGLVEPSRKTLTAGRVGNHEDAVVQSAHVFGIVVEVVPGPRGQSAEHRRCGEHHGGIGRPDHAVAHLLQTGKVAPELLDLLTPFLESVDDGIRLSTYSFTPYSFSPYSCI